MALPAAVTKLVAFKCGCLTKDLRLDHLSALVTVNLSGTEIPDAAIASLPPTVTELRMCRCGDLTGVLRLGHLLTLAVLDLGGTAVSDAAIASLPVTVTELGVDGCPRVTTNVFGGLLGAPAAKLRARGVTVDR